MLGARGLISGSHRVGSVACLLVSRLFLVTLIDVLAAVAWYVLFNHAVQTLTRLETLYDWPGKQRVPNLLLIGPTNNGKSMSTASPSLRTTSSPLFGQQLRPSLGALPNRLPRSWLAVLYSLPPLHPSLRE